MYVRPLDIIRKMGNLVDLNLGRFRGEILDTASLIF